MATDENGADLLPTGVAGLDGVLGGGLRENRIYLIEGAPGTGKTTMALQFALQGVREGQRVLYVSFSQRREELVQIARSHGWSLDGVDVMSFEDEGLDVHVAEHTLFHPSEVDLTDAMQAMLRRVDAERPERLVIDSAAEIRLLAGGALRGRRQFLLLKQTLGERGITALVLDDESGSTHETSAHALMHGVVRLEQIAPDYGELYRRLRIMKMRGVAHPTGFHDFEIRRGGIDLYPSLTTVKKGREDEERAPGMLESGVPSLDGLLGGGLDYGSACLVLGVSGTGKSSLAALYALASARKGERAAIYTFDERRATLLARMEGLSLSLRPALDDGLLEVTELSPSTISAGHFTARLREDVLDHGVRMIVIDSLTGYTSTFPHHRRAATHLHDLLTHFAHLGVLTLITVPQHGLVGEGIESQMDVSYLADSVVLLRHYEAQGTLGRAIAVVKRRRGGHDRNLHDLVMSDDGIWVGGHIQQYQGVLTGVPAIGETYGDGGRRREERASGSG